jgi:hypothetical protein
VHVNEADPDRNCYVSRISCTDRSQICTEAVFRSKTRPCNEAEFTFRYRAELVNVQTRGEAQMQEKLKSRQTSIYKALPLML